MTEYLKEALGIVKAQAGVRTMTEEQMLSMVQNVARGIQQASEEIAKIGQPERDQYFGSPEKAIRDASILCLECGKEFKLLTRRHLSRHGMTPEEYREAHGYPKNLPLVARSLARDRRKKMQNLRLWEKRKCAMRKLAEA